MHSARDSCPDDIGVSVIGCSDDNGISVRSQYLLPVGVVSRGFWEVCRTFWGARGVPLSSRHDREPSAFGCGPDEGTRPVPQTNDAQSVCDTHSVPFPPRTDYLL